MKNCTKHSIERWVERIAGIATRKERDEYIRDNLEQIKEHMNKTFEFAEFIYKGQIGDNTTKNYYIQNDVIFVMNTQDDAIITVYKIDFGFTNELNLTIAKGLKQEIHRLVTEKDEIDFKVLEEKETKEAQSKEIQTQINIWQEQVKILQEKKKSIDEQVKKINSDSKVIDLEIQKFTNQLVNSKEYREDLVKM